MHCRNEKSIAKIPGDYCSGIADHFFISENKLAS
jgi:hypothetical protein